MAQSLVQNYVHIVFSTKDRRPWLQQADTRGQVHAYLAGMCKNLYCPPFQIGGTEDHVHVLCSLSKNLSLKDLVMNIKKESSKWVKRSNIGFDEFHWQGGYGGFSISPSHISPLKKYIVGQEEHHREETFRDELRRLFRKYCIPFDERYVWE